MLDLLGVQFAHVELGIQEDRQPRLDQATRPISRSLALRVWGVDRRQEPGKGIGLAHRRRLEIVLLLLQLLLERLQVAVLLVELPLQILLVLGDRPAHQHLLARQHQLLGAQVQVSQAQVQLAQVLVQEPVVRLHDDSVVEGRDRLRVPETQAHRGRLVNVRRPQEAGPVVLVAAEQAVRLIHVQVRLKVVGAFHDGLAGGPGAQEHGGRRTRVLGQAGRLVEDRDDARAAQRRQQGHADLLLLQLRRVVVHLAQGHRLEP